MVICTVFTPAYNSGDMICHTIDSVLNQTFTDFEFIIIDDCSTDHTPNILNTISSQDNRIKVYRNDTNKNIGNTFYEACKLIQGRYFAIIGHDDVWQQNYLETQINCLQSSDAITSFSSVISIDINGNEIPNNIFHNYSIDSLNRYELFARLIGGNFLCAASAIVDLHKLACNITDLVSYNNDRLQDYELWLQLLLEGEFIYNTASTCFYRIHGNNFSLNNKTISQGKYELLVTLRRVFYSTKFLRFIENYNVSSSNESHFLFVMFSNLINASKYTQSTLALLPELCEYLLSKNINLKFINDFMVAGYNQLGMLNKTRTNNQGMLVYKIKVYIFGDDEEIFKKTNDCFFEIVNNVTNAFVILFNIKNLNMLTNSPVLREKNNLHKLVMCYLDASNNNLENKIVHIKLDDKFSNNLLDYIENYMIKCPFIQ